MKGSKWCLGVLAASAVLLLGTGSALAARHFPTTIHFDNAAPVGDTFVYSGHVTSPKHACVVLRVVGLVAFPQRVALDFDLTSLNGAWAMRADPTGANTLKARVAQERFGRRHHRKVCDSDSVAIPLQ
jgi:hypothetical protein